MLALATSRSSSTAKQCGLETGSSAPGRVRFKLVSRSALIINVCLGGWDPETGAFFKEINAQIDQAFRNVELNLMDAGGKGWSQVFRVNSYHVPINDEALEAMVRNFKKYMPDHEPIWTCVGVTRLGEDDMRVEIEVVAHDPDLKAV